MNKILVIEDDENIRANVLDLLEAEGYEGLGAQDGEMGVKLAVQHLPDLIICDVAMPGIDGYEVLEILSAKQATAVIPFVFLSARAERADIRRGMTLGADDYLTKPFTRVELLETIRARLLRSETRASTRPSVPARGLEAPLEGQPRERKQRDAERVVVEDSAMRALFDQIERIAKGAISVLILGETGVGKEVVAEEIHRASGRRGPFVPLNCGALTETLLESELFGHEKGAFTGAVSTKPGLFESAEGGTVFLDEVGDLPPATQVKLLRVLEDRKVLRVGGRASRSIDVRFVSATNRDVEHDSAHGGGFRQDLFFRLNGFTITVPPLRQRRADIAPLAERFIVASCRASNRTSMPVLSGEALALLQAYDWPGNIRELRNVIERAVLLCDGAKIGAASLPQKIASGAQPGRQTSSGEGPAAGDPRERLLEELEQLDRQRIVDALANCAQNQTQAAEQLGISRRTLVTRLVSYDLPRPRKR